MLSKELLAELHRLKRVDKLHAIQILVEDLALEEQGPLTPGAEYEVWSPYDCADAADTLMAVLEEHKRRSGQAQPSDA